MTMQAKFCTLADTVADQQKIGKIVIMCVHCARDEYFNRIH